VSIEAFKKLLTLNKNYGPSQDVPHIVFSALLQLISHGLEPFDRPPHVTITGTDESLTNRAGVLIETCCYKPHITSITDLPSHFSQPTEDTPGVIIVYIYHKLNQSILKNRLSHLLNKQRVPIVIIGNIQSIERAFLNSTIHINLPPTCNPLPRYYASQAEEEIKNLSNDIKSFWKEHGEDIENTYKSFQRPGWLSNRDEELWLSILATAEVIDANLRKPLLKEKMLRLAQNIVQSRKVDESMINPDLKILEVTQTFIKKNLPMLKRPGFYYGPKLNQFVREMLQTPNLRDCQISHVLRSYQVVIDTCRPRIQIQVKKKGHLMKKIIQPTCFKFDLQKLANVLDFFHGGKNGRTN